MTPSKQSVVAVLLALTVAFATVAMGPAAAAPSIDTSGADDTSSTSEITDETTIEGFNGTDNGTHIVQAITNNGTEASILIRDNASSSDYVAFRNESGVNITTAPGNSEGAHWNVSWTGDELADVEMGIDENKTVAVKVYNKTNESNSPHWIQVYLNNTDERSVINVDDGDVNTESGVDVFTDNGTEIAGLSVPFTGNDFSDASADGRSVNGTETDVVVVLSNATVSGDFTDATDDTLPGIFGGGEAESGDRIWSVPATLEGEPVPVFYDEAPDSFDTDERDYATFEEDVGGQQAVVYHLNSDDMDDQTIVDVQVFGGTGLSKALGVYGTGFASALNPLSIAGIDLGGLNLGPDALGAVLAPLFIGAPTRRQEA